MTVDLGQFRMLSSAVPPLVAGSYRARLEQTVTAGGPISPVDRQLVVTAPQFALSGTEVQSVFPPPNQEGAFDTRLPQIVLKRRTLPWERVLSASETASPSRRPWVALVLLTDTEGTLRTGVPVTDVIPPNQHAALGVTATSGACDCLETSAPVVAQVFPRADEVALLCHVREVPLADTELAGGDLDGYLSVVLANRLPQAGNTYGAYLISLEHRLDVLPTATGPGSASGTLRFPVLARWRFICATGGDFQALMQGLDVGALGTAPAGCPAVAPTGHVAITHRSRRGEQRAAWYRGPLTPRQVVRRPAGTPYFAADQGRAIASDGLEDLTDAAAFELGRLLAMASPGFLVELLAWRRTTMATDTAAELLARTPGATDLGLRPADASYPLGRAVLDNLTAPGQPLGTRLPATDLSHVIRPTDPQTIADGLGLDPALVDSILEDGDVDVVVHQADPVQPLETDFDVLADPQNAQLLKPLRDALARRVEQLAADAGLDLRTAVFDPTTTRPTTIHEVFGVTP
jgi:hypothetical protein